MVRGGGGADADAVGAEDAAFGDVLDPGMLEALRFGIEAGETAGLEGHAVSGGEVLERAVFV